MMKIILGVVLALVTAGILVVWYMGGFQPVIVEEHDQGPFTLVYKEMTGTKVKQVGDITTDLDTMLTRLGITQRKPLDVFFPDGKAEIGFAIENASAEQLRAVKEHANVREIPVRNYMIANFPWRNKLSFAFGYVKVNPALRKYREMHNYAAVEAYALNMGKTIMYLQPVVQ